MVRNKKYNRNKGVVLFVILMVIAAIVVVGLGFIVRGDVELAVGQTMELKADMDYLAESGLEHAKGLILNPQDTSGDFWTGAARQQIISGSNDYYDVGVVQLSEFNYQLTSTGYREIGGQEKAKSSLTAQLRLNPCIAYWQMKEQSIPSSVSITGDAYFGDKVVNYGNIYGDVYSVKTITNALFGDIQGQLYQNVSAAPINPPEILPADLSSVYYIGSDSYSVGQLIAGDYYITLNLSPNAFNPAGVYYCNGNITFLNTVNINGTLVVKGDLSIKGSEDVTIQAVKNFPALIIGGKLNMDASAVKLTTTGYTQVGDHIDMHNKYNSSITVNGALYVLDDGIKNTSTAFLTVNGMPQKASLAIWSSGGNLTRWSPAAGAFYKTITRNP